MPCPVEESLHPAIAAASGKSVPVEQLLNRLVNVLPIDARAQFRERQILRLRHKCVHPLDLLLCAATHDGACDVAPVTRLRIARENVEDDCLMRP